MEKLPELRQVVLLARDLEGALAEAKAFLGLNPGIRAAGSMAALGFEHEVLAIDRTFVEIVSPLRADSSPGRLLDRRGEGGYMVVVQVADADAAVDRAAALGLKPVMRELYEGNPLTQWHPRDLGTLAEIDEMRTAEWHFCPELSDTGSTAVAADIVSVEIGVPDPAEYARRWAAVLGLEIGAGQTTVTLARGEVRFVADTAGAGLRSVRLTASSPATQGRAATLCGVTFEVAAVGSGGG